MLRFAFWPLATLASRKAVARRSCHDMDWYCHDVLLQGLSLRFTLLGIPSQLAACRDAWDILRYEFDMGAVNSSDSEVRREGMRRRVVPIHCLFSFVVIYQLRFSQHTPNSRAETRLWSLRLGIWDWRRSFRSARGRSKKTQRLCRILWTRGPLNDRIWIQWSSHVRPQLFLRIRKPLGMAGGKERRLREWFGWVWPQ